MLFDIFAHFSKLEEHKGAVVICQNNHILVTTESTANSSGFRIPLPTRRGGFYLIRLKGRLLDGDRAFIYCESALDGERLVPREYYLEQHDKEFLLHFRANYTLTYFGILTASHNLFYRIKVDYCQVELVEYLSTLEESTLEVVDDTVEDVPQVSSVSGEKPLIDLLDLDFSESTEPTHQQLPRDLFLLDDHQPEVEKPVFEEERSSVSEAEVISEEEVVSEAEVISEEEGVVASESEEVQSAVEHVEFEQVSEVDLELDSDSEVPPTVDNEEPEPASYLDILAAQDFSSESDSESLEEFIPAVDDSSEESSEMMVLDENKKLGEYKITDLLKRYQKGRK